MTIVSCAKPLTSSGRVSLVLFLVAIGCACAPSVAHAAAMVKADRACPEGHVPTGDLGIGMFQCAGGECAVNALRQGGVYVHEFSTEPRIWHLKPGSAAARDLSEGDQILAVDGALVTTAEGGRLLANLHPGTPVRLKILRDGKELTVSLVPDLGCNMPRLVVSAGPTAGPPGRR